MTAQYREFNPHPFSNEKHTPFDASLTHFNFKGSKGFGFSNIYNNPRLNDYYEYKNKGNIELHYNKDSDIIELIYWNRGTEEAGHIKIMLVNMIYQLYIDGVINPNTRFILETINYPHKKLIKYYNKLGFRRYYSGYDYDYNNYTKCYDGPQTMKTTIGQFLKRNYNF